MHSMVFIVLTTHLYIIPCILLENTEQERTLAAICAAEADALYFGSKNVGIS